MSMTFGGGIPKSRANQSKNVSSQEKSSKGSTTDWDKASSAQRSAQIKLYMEEGWFHGGTDHSYLINQDYQLI